MGQFKILVEKKMKTEKQVQEEFENVSRIMDTCGLNNDQRALATLRTLKWVLDEN